MKARNWVIGAVMIAFLASGAMIVAAQEGAQAGVRIVANDNLSLRAAPTSDSDRLDTIPYLAELDVTAISPDHAWLATSYEGQRGWVNLGFVSVIQGSLHRLPISNETFLPNGGAVPTNVMVSPYNNLNYRTEPRFDLEPAGIISYRETLPALAVSQDLRFVLVRYHGHDVWVYRPFLRETFGSINDLPRGGPPVPVSLPAGADMEVQAGLPGICAGVGVGSAAPFDGGPGVHPVVVYPAELQNAARETANWNDFLGEWRPVSPGQAQLVLCVGEQFRDSIERCRYQGPDIYRIQYERPVRLVVAQTGEVLGETRLRGALPRECQDQERYSLTRLYGSEVDFNLVWTWAVSVLGG